MDDQTNLQSYRHEYVNNRARETPEQKCRDLISGIIFQAYVDACNGVENGLSFFDKDNRALHIYCNAIDLDPIGVSRRLKLAIEKYKTNQKPDMRKRIRLK